MKKILLTTTAVLTILFAQAQVNYCDSIDIGITSQTGNDVALSSGLSANIIALITDSSILWTMHNNLGFVNGANDSLSPTFNLPSPNSFSDTNSFCFQMTVDDNGTVVSCYVCDTVVWNGTSWMLMSMAQPTAINDFNSLNRELLKVVDILGRETKGIKNEVLFYIYDDGTVEKRIEIE